MVPRMSRRTGPTAAARAAAGPVGLDAEVLEDLPGILRAGLEADPPRLAGASLLGASQSGMACDHADGYARGWQHRSPELRRHRWIPARTDTIYDLASSSKVFTATAVMQLVEQGRLGLEDRVATHLPRFAANGKGE